MADVLRKNLPQVTEQFTKPRFELDWWESMLRVGLSSLIADVTNVLTISSGRCSASGSWIGLGPDHVEHSIGHTKQEERSGRGHESLPLTTILGLVTSSTTAVRRYDGLISEPPLSQQEKIQL